MTIVHQTQYSTVHSGDCLDVLKELPDESVHAVITDPPYGLSNTTPAQVAECLREWATGNTTFTPAKRGGFMGKDWDSFVPPPAVWEECFRVLKPGGHLLAFAGSRTQDLMGMSVRLAGFDIRDSVAWLYSTGMPKSYDVSKAIDKAGGDPLAFRRFARAYSEAVTDSSYTHTDIDRHLGIKSSSCYWAREDHRGGMPPRHHWNTVQSLLGLDQDLIKLYEALERNVVGTRLVPKGHAFAGDTYGNDSSHHTYQDTTAKSTEAIKWSGWGTGLKPRHEPILLARKPFAETLAVNVSLHGVGAINIDDSRVGDKWPPNVFLDEGQAKSLDDQGGDSSAFHVFSPKAPRSERPEHEGVKHGTVKPLRLMKSLIRMVTPPGGTILDPFAGSGTTLEAATQEGFESIGVEAHPDYLPLIAHRLERTAEPQETQPPLPDTAA